ncbi:MAG: hypothetical protein CSA35_01075 [Dethiosulfovibrio peptidovorans]|nr:MAG: hypothetical protein CSA35_01075 [Dethiosulfovibrio peptidovorans]
MPPSIQSIRQKVARHKGNTVRYRATKGRRKTEERRGVILETYPRLFTLYVESQHSKVSFSYAELLTKEVSIQLVNDNAVSDDFL